MKLRIYRKEFLERFKLAVSAAAKKDRPILQNIKVKADVDGVKLYALGDNLEVYFAIGVKCDVLELGDALLPGKTFSKLLESLKDDTFILTVHDFRIELEGKSGSLRLDSQSADDFPDILDFEESSYTEVTTANLLKLFRRTMFAVDKDQASFRSELKGLSLEMDNAIINAVGSTGSSLAWQQAPCCSIGGHECNANISIPVSGLKLLEKSLKIKIPLLGGASDIVKISVIDNTCWIVFKDDARDVQVRMRLLASKFPGWREVVQKVISCKNKAQVIVKSGLLLAELKTLAATLSSASPYIIFKCKANVLELRGGSSHSESVEGQADSNSSKISVPAVCSGEAEFAIKPAHLIEFLTFFEKNTSLTFNISDDHNLWIEDNDGLIFVAMLYSVP